MAARGTGRRHRILRRKRPARAHQYSAESLVRAMETTGQHRGQLYLLVREHPEQQPAARRTGDGSHSGAARTLPQAHAGRSDLIILRSNTRDVLQSDRRSAALPANGVYLLDQIRACSSVYMRGRDEEMISRRDFLTAVSGATAAALLPRFTWASGPTIEVPGKAGMIVRSARFLDLEMPPEFFDSWLTPVPHFFVRNHMHEPSTLDADSWRLSVGGGGADPLAANP